MSPAELYAAFLLLTPAQQHALLDRLHDAVFHPTYLAEPS